MNCRSRCMACAWTDVNEEMTAAPPSKPVAWGPSERHATVARTIAGLCIGAMVVLHGATARGQPPEPDPPAPSNPVATDVVAAGRVIDSLGRPIRGARVSVEGGAATATATDAAGRFRVTAPLGATLVIERDGFEVTLATVSGTVLDEIVLLRIDQLNETIEVIGEPPASAPGAAKLDRAELQRVPGAGGDVVKALTVMPGVVNLQVPLGFSGVVIRGSSPQDSKVLVDEFEVPLLFHNIAFRSIVPAESIASLDFLPGGFDVAYGRASSGIVSLTTRRGADRRSAQAEFSLIDGGLIAQGSAGKRTRYMIALRRSTIDFILPSIIPDDVDLSLTTVPRYWDEQIRIDHALSSKWQLALSSVGTDDVFELVASKDERAGAKRFFTRTRFLRTTGIARYHDTKWSANLALSTLLPEFVFELGASQYIRVRQPTVTPRAEIARNVRSAGGLTDLVWRAGGEAQVGRSSLELALPLDRREGEPRMDRDDDDTSMTFRGKAWVPDFAVWTAVAANLDRRIRATLGVRADVFARPGEVAIQPRGELQWKIAKPWTLRFNAGAYRRPPENLEELLDTNVRSERSTQLIAGVQYQPREGIRTQASFYYTDRTRLIRRDAMGALVNIGRGRSIGGELLGSYRRGPWFGWLSYSISRSTRVDTPGADRRLFDHDQPHSLNAAASWQTGKWQIGARFQVYSGLPYTPVEGSVFDNDRNLYIPIFGDVNSERAPMHHQLDLRVDRTWRVGPMALTAFIDVQNVYLNDSVVAYFYSFDYSERAAFRSLPLIPSIGLRGLL